MNHFRNSRRFKPIMYPLMIIGGAAFILLFGWIVMLLWNAILPDLVNVNRINFWQALGLLVLCKILFGGFRGKSGGWGNRKSFGSALKNNWSNMTPEERLKFKEELRRRCDPKRGEPPTEELPKDMD